MPLDTSKAPKTLPAAAKRMWVKAFNAAYEGTCDEEDACSARVAWSAVKKKYRKSGDTWVLKSAAVQELLEVVTPPQQFSFFITKAVTDKKTGEMRWSGVASDTGPEVTEDASRMTTELYDNFISRAEEFGMPFVSIAHLPPTADGFGVAGPVNAIYRDGEKFKAKGVFEDNPVGRAAYGAIRKDIEEKVPDDERIRFSIGFWDFSHYHPTEDFLFVRSALDDICPLCNQGSTGILFKDGFLEHITLTRVPKNERASIALDESEPDQLYSTANIRTRYDDAVAIVGEELADQLVEGLKGRSVVESRPIIVKAATVWQPLGGSLTLEDARKYIAARDQQYRLSDLWWMLYEVYDNILDASEYSLDERLDMIRKLLEEFRGELEGVSIQTMSRVVEWLDAQEVQPMNAIQTLRNALEQLESTEVTDETRSALEPLFNNAIQELGLVEQSEETPSETPTEDSVELSPESAALVAAFKTAIEPLAAQLADVSAVLQRATTTPESPQGQTQQPPQRRSVPAPAPTATPTPAPQSEQEESPIRAIARRSVMGSLQGMPRP